MKMNLKIPIILLLSSLLFMAFQCDMEGPVIEYQYNFVENIDLYPANKNYKVGDTIWIEYNNSDKKLFDAKSKQQIAIDSVFLGFTLGFDATYYAPVNPTGGFYDYVVKNADNVGLVSNPSSSILGFTFGCNGGNSQQFKIGLKLKHKGIYILRIHDNGVGPQNIVAGCPNRATVLPQSYIDYKFNITDENKDIYLSIPPHSRGESTKGYTESKIDAKQAFIVKVE